MFWKEHTTYLIISTQTEKYQKHTFEEKEKFSGHLGNK